MSKCNIQTLRGATYEGKLPFITKPQTSNVMQYFSGFFEKYNSFASYCWDLDKVAI